MEKFGIFELLDALAAIAETSAPPPSEERKVPDAVFAAPEYGDTPPPSPQSAPEQDALSGFLARHDGISKRVRK